MADTRQCDVYNCGYPSHWIFFTMVATTAMCWVLLELMERVFGMAPKITSVREIHDMALKDKDNPVGNFIVNKRLTKTYYDKFRIQTRGTMYYIRFVWSFSLFIAGCVTFSNVEWFKAHFIYLDASTVYLDIYQHVSACIIAFYLWELSANRYGKIAWSIIIHHWLTIAAAMQIIWGHYTPFATWYGFTIVSCTFPVDFALGLRATFSNRHPHVTRRFFKISFWWWTICLTVNISGQIFLIVNALLPSNFNQSIHVSSVFMMLVAICGWFYDDYQVLATLRDFSTQDYADADILGKRHSNHTLRMAGTLGGRSLFAAGMIDDIEKHLGNELTPPPPEKGQVLRHVAMHDMKQAKSKTQLEQAKPHEENGANESNDCIEKQRSSDKFLFKVDTICPSDMGDLADIQKEILYDVLRTPSDKK